MKKRIYAYFVSQIMIKIIKLFIMKKDYTYVINIMRIISLIVENAKKFMFKV